jgi:hypothetical protein
VAICVRCTFQNLNRHELHRTSPVPCSSRAPAQLLCQVKINEESSGGSRRGSLENLKASDIPFHVATWDLTAEMKAVAGGKYKVRCNGRAIYCWV